MLFVAVWQGLYRTFYHFFATSFNKLNNTGTQLQGSKGCFKFETHRRWSHCVVSLGMTLSTAGSTQEDPPQHDWRIIDWDVNNLNKQNMAQRQLLWSVNNLKSRSIRTTISRTRSHFQKKNTCKYLYEFAECRFAFIREVLTASHIGYYCCIYRFPNSKVVISLLSLSIPDQRVSYQAKRL